MLEQLSPGFSEVSFALFIHPSPVLSVKKETSKNLNTTLQSVCCGPRQRTDLCASFKTHGFSKNNYNHMGTFKAVKEDNELKKKEPGKVSCKESMSKATRIL